jgi:hypothetical protein
MARTYAQAQTEKARLLALGRRLQVRLIKNPLIGDDGAILPGGPGTNDYLVQVKDPRSTGTGPAAQANEASFRTQATALADTRWHDATAAQEHEIRIRGMVRGAEQNTPGHTGWLTYGAGESREGGDIPDSAVVFA